MGAPRSSFVQVLDFIYEERHGRLRGRRRFTCEQQEIDGIVSSRRGG
jgi:hypothetical protein